MNKNILLFISLGGIFLLLFLSYTIEPKLMKISSIDEKKLEQFVKIKGEVEKIKEISGLTILTISDETASINVVIRKKIDLIEGTEIEIVGKVREYNKMLEVEAIKIKIIWNV